MVLSSSSLSPWHFSSFKISRILGTFFQDITPRDHKTGHSAAAQERCLDVNTVSIIHQRRLLAIHLHLQEYSIQHSAHNLCQLLSWPPNTPWSVRDPIQTSGYIRRQVSGDFFWHRSTSFSQYSENSDMLRCSHHWYLHQACILTAASITAADTGAQLGGGCSLHALISTRCWHLHRYLPQADVDIYN